MALASARFRRGLRTTVNWGIHYMWSLVAFVIHLGRGLGTYCAREGARMLQAPDIAAPGNHVPAAPAPGQAAQATQTDPGESAQAAVPQVTIIKCEGPETRSRTGSKA